MRGHILISYWPMSDVKKVLAGKKHFPDIKMLKFTFLRKKKEIICAWRKLYKSQNSESRVRFGKIFSFIIISATCNYCVLKRRRRLQRYISVYLKFKIWYLTILDLHLRCNFVFLNENFKYVMRDFLIWSNKLSHSFRSYFLFLGYISRTDEFHWK